MCRQGGKLPNLERSCHLENDEQSSGSTKEELYILQVLFIRQSEREVCGWGVGWRGSA